MRTVHLPKRFYYDIAIGVRKNYPKLGNNTRESTKYFFNVIPGHFVKWPMLGLFDSLGEYNSEATCYLGIFLFIEKITQMLWVFVQLDLNNLCILPRQLVFMF